MVGRYSRNPGPTGVHYDKTTNKLYYSYQDPITGKDNAYYTDKEGKVVSSDDGGHYEWRTKAVYYDNKYLIYTRNGVKKTTLDYDVINYKHYFEFVPDVDDDLPLIRSPYGIDGPESTSWENMGKWARYLSDNFDKGKPGSKRRETGNAPWPIMFFVNVNPLVSFSNGAHVVFTGNDLYGNQIESQYVGGLWLMLSSTATFRTGRLDYRVIGIDQVILHLPLP